MNKLIELKNITKTFKQGSETIYALKKTNFSASAGELIAIIGPSGSGKSTFLTILGGLQVPTTGEVIVNGQTVNNLDEKARSVVRLHKIGFILQKSNLVPFLNINDQLNLYNKATKTKPNEKKKQELFKELGIVKLSKKFPSDLSGGEQQRVAIARAIYPGPAVILADEPTASLDSKKAFEVINLLSRETKSRNTATVIVTHDERLIDYCDRVFEMNDGELTERKK